MLDGLSLVLTYASGEAVQVGDRVCYADANGTVEVVAEGAEAENWDMFEGRAGVLVGSCELFGRVYVPYPDEWHRLALVARAASGPGLRSKHGE